MNWRPEDCDTLTPYRTMNRTGPAGAVSVCPNRVAKSIRLRENLSKQGVDQAMFFTR